MDSPRPRSSGFAAPRRVFTAPVPPSAPQPGASPQSAGGLVDTLYDHPNVKIVSFSAGARSLSVGPRAAAGPDIEPGSLSWSSQLERTIAVGPFRIYRAPGSVAFLSCGSALQPILPKSQVWCVDEESSKFVLQIRRPQYWRIEVPVEEQEDVRRAQQLREVFDAILQFEKTECPFQRSFTVELPERPQTPVKKRPWTPVRRSSASLPLTPVTPVEIARLHEGTPRGSICMGDLRTAGDARRALAEQARSLEPPAEEPVSADSDHPFSKQPSTPALSAPVPVERPPQQVPVIVAPQPKIREAAPSRVPIEKFKSPTESSESFVGRESWLATPLPPSPPISTPGSPRSAAPQLHPHDLSETAANQAAHDHTVTLKPSQTWSVATTESLPESECSAATAPSSLHDLDCASTCGPPPQAASPERSPTPTKDEPHTPSKSRSPSRSPSQTSASSSTRGRRATTTSSISPSRRALSPLPPAATLLTPSSRRRRPSRTTSTSPARTTTCTTTATQPEASHRSAPVQTRPRPRPQTQGPGTLTLAAVRRLPLTVLHKTCEILMSPPSHLIGLMLKVAARIAAGEWRGLVFGLGEAGERVSVAWDWSEDDFEEDEYDFEQDCGGYRGRGYERGWSSGVGRFGNRNGGGEFSWSRGRERAGRGAGRMKMAGAFPESDEEEEEEEEEIGPLDVLPASGRDKSVSSSPGRCREEEEGTAASVESPDRPTTTDADGGLASGEKQGKHDADTEWGVD